MLTQWESQGENAKNGAISKRKRSFDTVPQFHAAGCGHPALRRYLCGGMWAPRPTAMRSESER